MSNHPYACFHCGQLVHEIDSTCPALTLTRDAIAPDIERAKTLAHDTDVVDAAIKKTVDAMMDQPPAKPTAYQRKVAQIARDADLDYHNHDPGCNAPNYGKAIILHIAQALADANVVDTTALQAENDRLRQAYKWACQIRDNGGGGIKEDGTAKTYDATKWIEGNENFDAARRALDNDQQPQETTDANG